MKGRLGIQFHIAIGLLVALLAAFLINAGITTSQELPIDPQKSPTQNPMNTFEPVSYTHLRAHETVLDLV